MKKLTCIIIDDEEPARDLLLMYCEKAGNLEVLGAFENPLHAIGLIESKMVDVVFLDIQMNEMSGLELMQTLKYKPSIILTTAFREFAFDGFQLDAKDYLLKPINYERFSHALSKVSPTQETETPDDSPDFTILKSGREQHKVYFRDITHIESLSEYVTYYTPLRKLIVFASLKSLIDELPSSFMRVHRSYIINMDCIEAISNNKIIIGDKQIPISNTYRKEVLERFNNIK